MSEFDKYFWNPGTNINPKTNIRFGFGNGNNEHLEELCEKIIEQGKDYHLEEALKGLRGQKRQDLCDMWETTVYTLKTRQYHASYDNNDNTITVLKSPFMTMCRECSICAPNGGDLENPSEHGYWTYCSEETPGAVKARKVKLV